MTIEFTENQKIGVAASAGAVLFPLAYLRCNMVKANFEVIMTQNEKNSLYNFVYDGDNAKSAKALIGNKHQSNGFPVTHDWLKKLKELYENNTAKPPELKLEIKALERMLKGETKGKLWGLSKIRAVPVLVTAAIGAAVGALLCAALNFNRPAANTR